MYCAEGLALSWKTSFESSEYTKLFKTIFGNFLLLFDYCEADGSSYFYREKKKRKKLQSLVICVITLISSLHGNLCDT